MDGLDLQRLIAALLMPLPLSLMLAGAGLALLAGETRGRLHRGPIGPGRRPNCGTPAARPGWWSAPGAD